MCCMMFQYWKRLDSSIMFCPHVNDSPALTEASFCAGRFHAAIRSFVG